ncbi:saccharopine dehydrogenase family protein [Methylocapsa palsarum]|uniref:Uncharacterized conserved protein n=1 Tax=Methylocapsa palsarum TaxID=1612308 RepID=A0A1I3Z9Y9_9HYPH|nr:saccharopine dehydrogenase NADP-binding domain-containing protein [Methylocapsa palsarum]SFK40877.1 Uncharacterized conserved protein [Methylocapsa palsarum]
MQWMIYGANGYTGELIAREAKRRGAAPVLAGRNGVSIAALATELDLPSKVFSLDAPTDLAAALDGTGLVLNCAGPFSKTAVPLMRACLAARAHYLDITGEIEILEGAHRFDAEARAAGIILCPGVGFDVAPTDCVALMLKTALPDAHELALGFETAHKMSQGTAKTLIESLGKSGKVRRDGKIADLPIGQGFRQIDFGCGVRRAMPIPWGDVASAYYTTGVPNIMVYTPISPARLAIARLTNVFGFVIQRPRVQAWLAARIEHNVVGPDAAAREASPTWIWGEARTPGGQTREVRFQCSNGYTFTVFSALAIVERLLATEFPPGCWTPAAIMGQEFILSLPGTTKID